jgi:hypothetical protein
LLESESEPIPAVFRARSSIPGAGEGLFANRELRIGELREPLRGEYKDENAQNRLFRAQPEKPVTLMYGGKGIVLDYSTHESFARYANTITEADRQTNPHLHFNSEFRDLDAQEDCAYLVNTEVIPENHEIFVDYGNEFLI